MRFKKRYESTEDDRRLGYMCPREPLVPQQWHSQRSGIQTETSSKMDTPFYFKIGLNEQYWQYVHFAYLTRSLYIFL